MEVPVGGDIGDEVRYTKFAFLKMLATCRLHLVSFFMIYSHEFLRWLLLHFGFLSPLSRVYGFVGRAKSSNYQVAMASIRSSIQNTSKGLRGNARCLMPVSSFLKSLCDLYTMPKLSTNSTSF